MLCILISLCVLPSASPLQASSASDNITTFMWPLGQEVKTPPSHGGIRGSIPLEATKKIALLPSYFRSVWHWRLFFWLFRAKRKSAKRILRELA